MEVWPEVWSGVVAGGLALVGTIVGLVAGNVVSKRQEERRWKRDDSLRFQERLLTACQDYAVSATKVATEVAHGGGMSDSAAVETLMRSEALLNFVGSANITIATRAIRFLLHIPPQGASANLADYQESFRRLKLNFDNAVRRELGLELHGGDDNERAYTEFERIVAEARAAGKSS